jgi:hypothetical protein
MSHAWTQIYIIYILSSIYEQNSNVSSRHLCASLPPQYMDSSSSLHLSSIISNTLASCQIWWKLTEKLGEENS